MLAECGVRSGSCAQTLFTTQSVSGCCQKTVAGQEFATLEDLSGLIRKPFQKKTLRLFLTCRAAGKCGLFSLFRFDDDVECNATGLFA